MQPKEKTEETFEIETEHKQWLESMVEVHGLPDVSKALRILLDYAIAEGNPVTIFEEIRCRHC